MIDHETVDDAHNASPAKPPWWRALLVPIGIFAALWLVYGIALALVPSSPLAAYHNDTWWPTSPYLVNAQPGLALQIFGHAMMAFVGGTFIAILVVAIFRLVGQSESKWAGRTAIATYAVVFLYSFGLLRAIPGQVTEIDTHARTLVLRSFTPLTFLPMTTKTLRMDDMLAIAARVDKYADWRRESDMVLRLYASMTDGEMYPLGLRPCGTHDKAACLETANRDAAELLAMCGMGNVGYTVATNAKKHLRLFKLVR